MSESAAANLREYDCWADTYPPEPHNPLMRAEQRAVLAHWPDVGGACALDLACGSGRYGRLLRQQGADQIVSLDFSPRMLQRLDGTHRVRANMMQLPFASGIFDFVVSGLAVGHAPDLVEWMCEVSRVLAAGGTIVYSDFHADAAAAGMTRSFVDLQRREHFVSHYRYAADDHRRAAAAAGLTIDAVQELRIGVELQEPFAGSERFYARWRGLPIVLIVRARKGTVGRKNS